MRSKLKNLLLLATGAWSIVSVSAILFTYCTPLQLPPSTETVQGADRDPELGRLIDRYYPERLSQRWETAFIRDYFQDQQGGFFVDVGASHYRTRSTTHYLDKSLGWHGIAIDPIEEFAADYARHRPRTKYLQLFVGDTSDQDVDFFVVKRNTRLSTGNRELAARQGAYETRTVKTATLTDILDAHEIDRVDLIKIDIERWEPAALRGFDIDRFKPRLVVIEDHADVSGEIHEYFERHKYALIESYTRWDGRNAYFVPQEHLAEFLERKGIDERWGDDYYAATRRTTLDAPRLASARRPSLP